MSMASMSLSIDAHHSHDAGSVAGRALERLQGRAVDDGDVVAVELVLGEQLADFHLDELQQLRVVHHVDLVQVDDDVRHAHLTGEQDVLAGLRHGAVGGGDDQDRAVHLGGTGDHVLDVVGVARAVDVRVVALVGLVLHVRDGDGDAALALFGGLVDLVERREVGLALGCPALRDGSGERRLTMVDVTDGADVHVRLGALELLLGHRLSPSSARRRLWRRSHRRWTSAQARRP